MSMLNNNIFIINYRYIFININRYLNFEILIEINDLKKK